MQHIVYGLPSAVMPGLLCWIEISNALKTYTHALRRSISRYLNKIPKAFASRTAYSKQLLAFFYALLGIQTNTWAHPLLKWLLSSLYSIETMEGLECKWTLAVARTSWHLANQRGMKKTTKIQRKNWQSSSTEKWENEKEIEVE